MEEDSIEQYKKIIDLHNRNFLIALKEKAWEESIAKELQNELWKKAYEELAQSANVLDAFIARRRRKTG